MKHKYLRNVATLELNQAECKGCGMCVEVCPHEVFLMEGDKAVILDKDSCIECGACAQNCPFSAITVRSGVGCAYAIIIGKLTGTEPNCGCSGDASGCC
jgi:NAD-dependent dihydropyrimidine dehydrogenase PreA subunit